MCRGGAPRNAKRPRRWAGHQRGPAQVLRSRSPDGVEQEVWGHLLVHHAIRRLMHDCAGQTQVDTDRLSFTRTLRLARRHVTAQAAFSP
ncbi:hypothetical protein [Streptomyces sp. NBC_00724]|uniref:hypothetical protein n=1 Tax=Streptomyces sp. NBC_00724 TaxID=2975812 RepID=UPI003FA799FC